VTYVRVFTTANQSVVYNVPAPQRRAQGIETFGSISIFFAILYLRNPLTFLQNFTEIVLREALPRAGGVKRKRGIAT